MDFDLFIPGIPKGQPRHRAFAFKRGTRWVARVYPSAAGADWRSRIMIALRPLATGIPCNRPVSVYASFILPRPQRLRPDNATSCPHKPDVDNLLKSIMDGLVQAGILLDDRLVTLAQTSKKYAVGTQTPGCWLRVMEDNAE